MQRTVHVRNVGLLGAALQLVKDTTRAKAEAAIETYEGTLANLRANEISELSEEEEEEEAPGDVRYRCTAPGM